MQRPLRARWLGRVTYDDAWQLQRRLYAGSPDNHLLLLEHTPVFTLGARASLDNLLVDPAEHGAELVTADRGGDITWHGPGQLVGYPIVWVPGKRGGGMADTVAYVDTVEQLIIDTLTDLGLPDVGRLDDHPGVWVEPQSGTPRKIAAIGVRLTRGRSMHGFALNVHPDLAWFDRMIPCGIDDKAVTSLAAEGIDVDMRTVVDRIVAHAEVRWGSGLDRQDVVWRERPEDLTPFSRGEGPERSRVRPTRLFFRRARPTRIAPQRLPIRKRTWKVRRFG